MEPPKSGPTASRQTGSFATAILAALLFGALTALVEPPWPHIERSSFGHLILTAAHLFPLIVLSLVSRPGSAKQWLACLVASLGSVGLALHAGLSATIVESIDAGAVLSGDTALALSGIFLSTAAVPIGLLLVHRRRSAGLATYLWVPTVTGAASQALWFGLVRLVQGASGIELWFAARIIIHGALGLTAGFLFGGARIFRPLPYPSHWGGVTELLISRLPHALPIALLLTGGFVVSGILRVAAELSDTTRLVTVRLDDYFLSLTNLRRAEQAALVYPGLFSDLERSRNALLGAASFDPELTKRTGTMLQEIERKTSGSNSGSDFRDAVISVDRRLLANGEPFFLEPHTMGEGQGLFKFLFRYRVERRGRYGLEGGRSVPVIRLRRLDDILVDTPYTGLSYPGIGTVLMDHIDEVVLRSDAALFSGDALALNPDEGRFAATALRMRKERRGALENATGGALPRDALEKLAAFSDQWRGLADLTHIRQKMDVATLSAYDALTEAVALETEVHEARHALDGPLPTTLPELEELSAGPLAGPAVSEIRAYLTEIIDGPLGPGFGLSTLAKMIIGPDARANAYFFAAMVIIEGLWGEKVRRPDIVERQSAVGVSAVVMPITPDHPGWLSYSRIHGACSDLAALDAEELKARAVGLFEAFFHEEYVSIRRRR
jgi:hypothetical protein